MSAFRKLTNNNELLSFLNRKFWCFVGVFISFTSQWRTTCCTQGHILALGMVCTRSYEEIAACAPVCYNLLVDYHADAPALQTLRRKGYDPTHKRENKLFWGKNGFSPQLFGPRREDWQQGGSWYLLVILNLVLLGLAYGKRPRAAALPLPGPRILHGKCF